MTEQRFDLVVRNGTIVTPAHREQADVDIAGGRIAQLGGTMTGAGESGAGGLPVVPGGIDAHVHLMCARFTAQLAAAEQGEPVWAGDFWTGSLAAIAGGITTVGNMTFALPGESMTQAVARDMGGARAEAAADAARRRMTDARCSERSEPFPGSLARAHSRATDAVAPAALVLAVAAG